MADKAAKMAGNKEKEMYDLLLLVDATASMQAYLTALQQSPPRIISISALTGCFSRIGLLGYRDYTEPRNLLDWSGWLDPAASTEDKSQPDLLQKAKEMQPDGGGDYPEALKTALARAYELARPEATTLVLLYTDAPPHLVANKVMVHQFGNYTLEQKVLQQQYAYGGHGPAFADWVSGTGILRNGTKHFQIFSIIHSSMIQYDMGSFVYLSTLTNGATIQLSHHNPVHSPDIISKATIELLLAWMGVSKAGQSSQTLKATIQAELIRYIDGKGISNAKCEDDPNMMKFFRVSDRSTSSYGRRKDSMLLLDNLTKVELNHEVLLKHLPKRQIPVDDFAKQWTRSGAYRNMAERHLTQIIQSDVQAMATNPVFGTLWRAVCSDRKNPQRDGLVAHLSKQIDDISDPSDRERMKIWLEESYDFGADIAEAIESVPENEQFPCVCLDPTQRFEAENVETDVGQSIKNFTRTELLEIGRSCDPRVLSRLSKVLTRLTYIKSAEDMPEHIAVASKEEVPRIPIALTKQKYGQNFWRYLLHIIVPGTLLSTRPGALLAALALCVGLSPLRNSAEQEMMRKRDHWNDIEVPENWNASCLSLLLDADSSYRAHHPNESKTLLKEEDRALFEQLIAFHILEMNLNTPLAARLGWTPDKSIAPIGPLVLCRECKLPRSVTIMKANSICGLCATQDYTSPRNKQKSLAARVSADQTDISPATWVECSMHDCRAQYVVYNVEDLNVRSKCHYCRQAGSLQSSDDNTKSAPAPFLECKVCRNRMIWPEKLRPETLIHTEFTCPACQSEAKTIVEIQVTPLNMRTVDEMAWLVLDTQQPTTFPFDKVHAASIFKVISKYGPKNFQSQIKLLHLTDEPLLVYGKPIHDTAAVKSTLESWISSRHVGKDTCSMCFTTAPRSGSHLTAVCGRRDCEQKACLDCMSQWYGLNGSGQILNVAALSCPFCRRLATGNRLRRYGHGAHAVKDLQLAVRDNGRWVYAWCRSCEHARRYVARECARGMPAALANWRCEECTESERVVQLLQERIQRQVRREEADEAELERLQEELRRLQLRPVRLCPGCGTAIEKDGGCDHMECSVCCIHWCWVCVKTLREHDVAQHMLQEHGGFYAYSSEDDDPEYSD